MVAVPLLSNHVHSLSERPGLFFFGFQVVEGIRSAVGGKKSRYLVTTSRLLKRSLNAERSSSGHVSEQKMPWRILIFDSFGARSSFSYNQREMAPKNNVTPRLCDFSIVIW